MKWMNKNKDFTHSLNLLISTTKGLLIECDPLRLGFRARLLLGGQTEQPEVVGMDRV
jgi:hypothetical protein